MNLVIEKEEIEEILEKYCIGKKPLSLVLGWGEVTIIRYLEGKRPDKFHSDVLWAIKNDVNEMLKYLEKNRDFITDVAYKKAISRIMEIKLEEDRSKIYLISKHIIAKIGDITPLALQKILYYIQGFSSVFLEKEMFIEDCEAWVHGPVYKEIYDRFKVYRYHPIEGENFQLYSSLKDTVIKDKEIELIDAVIKHYGCYSGKVLEEMTHDSRPWQLARLGVGMDENSNQVIKKEDIQLFFRKICQEYKIESVSEIAKYSKKMFQKVVR